MTTWAKDELQKIAAAEELHVSPVRDDGTTYRKPTPIWSVSVGDTLYARGYTGQNVRWYQDAMRQKVGRIRAAGVTKDVAFEPVDGAINDQIDDAYRTKYRSSPYVNSIVGAAARSATVKITPRA